MRRLFFLLTLAVAPAVLGAAAPARAQGPAPPSAWSVSDCQTCHDKAVGPSFTRSKHGGLDQSCARCHPNVAEHFAAQAAGQSGGPVPTLKKLSAKALNDTCLACHEKANQTSWLNGKHARMNVACTDCHSVHDYKSVKAQLKTERDPETCATCHKATRAKMLRTSHHPVREGKMGCSSCHNPHEGAVPNMLKADSVNDLCYKCHAEKRGPFAFEHAPVREDCVSCHEPHGTNHPRLLTQKMPNLCYSCHFTGSGHFGSGDNFNTEKGVPVAPAGAPSGYPTVNSRFIERSCRTCHVKVHGSNHPSGAFFVR